MNFHSIKGDNVCRIEESSVIFRRELERTLSLFNSLHLGLSDLEAELDAKSDGLFRLAVSVGELRKSLERHVAEEKARCLRRDRLQ